MAKTFPFLNFSRCFSLAILLFFFTNCKDTPPNNKTIYKYLPPDYTASNITATTDTLHFLLNDSSYNNIRSLNIFWDHGTEYVSFFDQRSLALLIYRIMSPTISCRIPLSHFLDDKKIYKTSVYVKNYDSIFISNNTSLYLFDSAGRKKASTPYLLNEDHLSIRALLGNDNPPIIIGKKIYTGVKKSASKRIEAYYDRKPLCQFDLRKDSVQLQYSLPDIYFKHLYGLQYLYSSFCFSSKNRFVFSFAADTNIYETDLSNYHVSYYGKSSFQDKPIQWISKSTTDEETFKNYLTGQAYGAIYYDAYNHRFLRVAKQKISTAAYDKMERNRKQTIIIFDEHFKIIGESPIANSIDLNSILFSKEGTMYARTNFKDEFALHFVKLQYHAKEDSNQLTKIKH